MISVIIPTLNAARHLPATLAAVAGAGEIIVADGGSTDDTTRIATTLGAKVVSSARGRGTQLAAGARAASGQWLLFLHADTRPAAGWENAVEMFTADPANRERAAVFRLALDSPAPQARRLERLVALRTRILGLPYGDQGLLIGRAFHDELGGFRPLPLMEDVDMVRRVGRARIALLPCPAVTSAERWHREGWVRRSARNLGCLVLYFAGVPPHTIARLYG